MNLNDQTLGALTRRVSEAISRRDSLLSLGATALAAAVAHPALTAAGKGNNGKNKKAKKAKKKCKKQVGQCSTFLAGACLGDPVCESAIACCGLFSNCNAAAALPCIFIN